jgi:glutamyl-Q tRNA(Asp) synthetase
MAASEPAQYVGRFAPSPTGPLHFGSWLLRIEDIDPRRQQEGAIDEILTGLDRYGFEWDGPVAFQSDNADRHRRVISDLRAAGLAYPCSCSRRELATARQGPLGSIYPGTCRTGSRGRDYAVRVRTDDAPIEFIDRLQGDRRQRLESESGDFVILRRDGLIAYHLAVVVDDFDQGVTEVVRGIDLLDSTPRQIYLQRLLGYREPGYLHIPIAANAAGQKLSKLTGAPPISLSQISQTLVLALEALGQRPPPELAANSPHTIWSWSIKHWQPEAMSGQTAIGPAEDALAWRQNGLS